VAVNLAVIVVDRLLVRLKEMRLVILPNQDLENRSRNPFRARKTDQGIHLKQIKDAISKLRTVSVVKCSDQGKPIKEAISKPWTVPVHPVHRSRKTDQRRHFQTADSSCGQVYRF
jgi:hypothetical protein